MTTLPWKNQVFWDTTLHEHGALIISLLGLFNPDDDGTMILKTTLWRTHCDISEDFSLQQHHLENHISRSFPFTFYYMCPTYVFLCHHLASLPFFMMVDIKLFYSQTNSNVTYFLKNYCRNWYIKKVVPTEAHNFQYNIFQFIVFTF